MKYISSLLNDATPIEAKFVLNILLGTLRLGIAENTVMDALSIGFTVCMSNIFGCERIKGINLIA